MGFFKIKYKDLMVPLISKEPKPPKKAKTVADSRKGGPATSYARAALSRVILHEV
ncbi:hypothetical protein IFR05_004165 [Cadophora sp. M221]|nr:hypothetical protein IFR05_004165 [Cadophora sp. M221]